MASDCSAQVGPSGEERAVVCLVWLWKPHVVPAPEFHPDYVPTPPEADSEDEEEEYEEIGPDGKKRKKKRKKRRGAGAEQLGRSCSAC